MSAVKIPDRVQQKLGPGVAYGLDALMKEDLAKPLSINQIIAKYNPLVPYTVVRVVSSPLRSCDCGCATEGAVIKVQSHPFDHPKGGTAVLINCFHYNAHTDIEAYQYTNGPTRNNK